MLAFAKALIGLWLYLTRRAAYSTYDVGDIAVGSAAGLGKSY